MTPQLKFQLPEEERAIARVMQEKCCSRDRAKEILNEDPKPPKPEPRPAHWRDENDREE
jgi:hypothetical protein